MASSQAMPVSGQVQQKPKRIAGVIIGGHGFQHMYADGFLVLLPAIYSAFGMTPISAGAMQAVRQAASGLFSMGGGFVIDLFSGKRGLLLSASLFMMGLGYLLVAAAPNYWLLLAALALGSAAASFWHPVGLGILSYTFPQNRAFVVSLHRSSGNVGELITPGLIALAALALTWRQILLAGFLIVTAVAFALLVSLHRIGLQNRVTEKRAVGEQFRSLGSLFKDRALPSLLLVSGMRGMADRAFVFFLPLFIAQSMRETSPGVTDAQITGMVGIYFMLLVAAGVVISPLFGVWADRIGRKPVMIATLIITNVFLVLMWQVGELGIIFGALVFGLGAIRFVINNLTQAASLDLAEGKRLEGSMIGLLWGNNALFGAFSPLLLGVVIATVGNDDFATIFPYAIALHVITLFAAFLLPETKRQSRTPTAAG